MLLEEQIQRELVRLLNKWSEGYETTLLEMFVLWTNLHLVSPYKIVEVSENFGKSDLWVLTKSEITETGWIINSKEVTKEHNKPDPEQ